MNPRASRPPAIQTLKIPTIVIHHAEPTPGLTPRTPYSQNSADEHQDVDDVQIKVHLSPSAPITPVQPRMPRKKPIYRTPVKRQPKAKLNRSWRVATWSAVLALFITALLSLHNLNFNSRSSPPPSTFSGKPMEWITIKPQRAAATPLGYSTRTLAVVHPTETLKPSVVP